MLAKQVWFLCDLGDRFELFAVNRKTEQLSSKCNIDKSSLSSESSAFIGKKDVVCLIPACIEFDQLCFSILKTSRYRNHFIRKEMDLFLKEELNGRHWNLASLRQTEFEEEFILCSCKLSEIEKLRHFYHLYNFRISDIFLPALSGLKLDCNELLKGTDLALCLSNLVELYFSNKIVDTNSIDRTSIFSNHVIRYSRWVWVSIILCLCSIIYSKKQTCQLNHFKDYLFLIEQRSESLNEEIEYKKVLLEENAHVNKFIIELNKIRLSRSYWELFLADFQERLIRVQDVWLDQLECIDLDAEYMLLNVEGRMLDRENPLKKVSLELKNRVQLLFEILEESSYVKELKNESLDTSKNGVVTFRIRLYLSPNPFLLEGSL